MSPVWPQKTWVHEGPMKLNCATCEGLGEWDEGPLPARSSVQISPEYKRVICPDCEGKGWLMSDQGESS